MRRAVSDPERPAPAAGSGVESFGDLELDREELEVRRGGATVQLQFVRARLESGDDERHVLVEVRPELLGAATDVVPAHGGGERGLHCRIGPGHLYADWSDHTWGK